MAKAVFRIEHRLGVQAPAEAVWQVLGDLEGWGAWNPLYPKVEGKLGFGERLLVAELIPPGEPVQITPTVVDWTPEAQIIWRQSQSFGFLKRVRYFEIDPLSEVGCVFANGEDWYGRPARYVTRARRRAMQAAFQGMGEALRDRVMAVWRP